MEYLSEDPTYLAGGLAALGLVFLVALKITQQGKYLIRAGIALGLALLVVGIEYVWVTDNERVEDVVYGLAKAVAESDGDAAAAYLDPSCTLEVGSESTNRMISIVTGQLRGDRMAEWLKENLRDFKFDYLRITRLKAEVRPISRVATAEFLAHTMGQKLQPFQPFATPPSGMGWSFGLKEVEPKVWKITRISPGQIDLGGMRNNRMR